MSIDKIMKKNNLLVRNELKRRKIYMWQLADYLNVSEVTMCKRLRYELPEAVQKDIVNKIREMVNAG